MSGRNEDLRPSWDRHQYAAGAGRASDEPGPSKSVPEPGGNHLNGLRGRSARHDVIALQRKWIGGEMSGYWLSLAVREMRDCGSLVVRFEYF